MNQTTQNVDMKAAIQEKYTAAALGMPSTGCCGGGCCDPITGNLYNDQQTDGIPAEAIRASLGCGNPTALIDLQPGQTVLDLGSGGGIDVLLSARRVGPTGKVYGVDMTDAMLGLARQNQQRANISNVEFLKGDIEALPLPDQSVDVVISNCVINLSTDKNQVFKEAFRVLRPGGRFAVSDVVVRGAITPEVRRSMDLWVGCVAGALEESEYRVKLAAAGFTGIEIEPWRVYDIRDAKRFLADEGVTPESVGAVDGKYASAFIRAIRPAERSCCGPTCCH